MRKEFSIYFFESIFLYYSIGTFLEEKEKKTCSTQIEMVKYLIHRNWWICNKLQNVFLIQNIRHYIISTFFGIISCKLRGTTVNAICKSRWIKGRISRLKGKEKNTFFHFLLAQVMKKEGTTFDKTFCHVQYKKKKVYWEIKSGSFIDLSFLLGRVKKIMYL